MVVWALAMLLTFSAVGMAGAKAHPDVVGPIAMWLDYFSGLGYVNANADGSLYSTTLPFDIGDILGFCCPRMAIAGHPKDSNLLYVTITEGDITGLHLLDIGAQTLTHLLDVEGRSNSLGSDCDGFLYTTTWLPGGAKWFHQIDPETLAVVTTVWEEGSTRDFAWTPTSNSWDGELWATKPSGGNPPFPKFRQFATGVEYFDTGITGYLEGLAMDLREMAYNPSGPTYLIVMDHHGNLYQVSGEQPGDQNWVDLGLEVGGADLANVPGYCYRLGPIAGDPGPGGDPGGDDPGAGGGPGGGDPGGGGGGAPGGGAGGNSGPVSVSGTKG